MSTPLEQPEWKVEVRCPHGYRALVPFDSLGYLTKPKDEQCDQHLVKDIARRPFPMVHSKPGRWQVWRETRRARKRLRDVRPEDFDGS